MRTAHSKEMARARCPGVAASAAGQVPLPPGVVASTMTRAVKELKEKRHKSRPAIPGLPKVDQRALFRKRVAPPHMSQRAAAVRHFIFCEIRKWKVVIS